MNAWLNNFYQSFIDKKKNQIFLSEKQANIFIQNGELKSGQKASYTMYATGSSYKVNYKEYELIYQQRQNKHILYVNKAEIISDTLQETLHKLELELQEEINTYNDAEEIQAIKNDIENIKKRIATKNIYGF